MYLAFQVAVGVVIGLSIFGCFAAAIYAWWEGEARRRRGAARPVGNDMAGMAWMLLLSGAGAFAVITLYVILAAR
jgi:hypothetical protein